MLFCKSKGPKLKLKHPELLQPNVAIKLGKKWKTMGAEKQEKYKQQQAALKKTYDAEIEQFYAANPEARLAPLRCCSCIPSSQSFSVAKFFWVQFQSRN